MNPGSASFTINAPAKLNLSLAVDVALQDEKHLIQSVYTTIGLHDRLDFNYDPSSPRSIDIQMRFAPGLMKIKVPPPKNIIYQAMRAFEDSFDCVLDGRLAIRVSKRIPIQGGLGGGSSDAAATLQAMLRLTGIKPDESELNALAAALGADVAFFLNGGCALMGGVGEKRLADLALPALDVVLVKPSRGLSTKRVYQRFSADPVQKASLVELVSLLDQDQPAKPEMIASCLANNLTQAAVSLMPEISSVIDRLGDQPGILKAMLAGSGSTVFAVAKNEQAARAAAACFEALGFWTAVSRTA